MPSSTDNINTRPFDDFESAGRAVLSSLSRRFGFGFWMITRTEGEDWIVLQTDDSQCGSKYPIAEGSVFKWADSYCSRMVAGDGPYIAENAQSHPIYRDAEIGRAVKIGAYIGIPIRNGDNSLFGTLCAIDPEPQSPDIQRDLPLIETMARLLSSILAFDLKAITQERALELSQKEAATDVLTGLKNRRGWNCAKNSEELRAKRYGHSISALMIDIDGLKETNDTGGHSAGDDLICRAAEALSSSVRDSDIIARIGGDEFGVLALDCNDTAAQKLTKKLYKRLKQNRVQASIGAATRRPDLGLDRAIERADEAMYKEKQSHKLSDS